jgi:hypothetical protein
MGSLDDIVAASGGGWANPGNSVTWPFGASSGDSRIVAGADTPPELLAYGVDQAILFYVTDSADGGKEIGYHWIGNGGYAVDNSESQRLWIGTCRYPIPGDPSSPSDFNVNQTYQLRLNTLADEPLIQDDQRMDIDTATLETGQPFLHGQTGSEAMLSGAAVGVLTKPVVFNVPFLSPPSVSTNIDNQAGTFARWYSRAVSVTANGFTMFVAKGDAADANVVVNFPVSWIAANAGG